MVKENRDQTFLEGREMMIYKLVDTESGFEMGFYYSEERAIDTVVGDRKDSVSVERLGSTVRLTGATFIGVPFVYAIVPVTVSE